MDVVLIAKLIAIPSAFVLGSYNGVFSQNVMPHLYKQPASVSTPIFAKIYNIGATTIVPIAAAAITAYLYLAFTTPTKRAYYGTSAALMAGTLPLTALVMKPGIDRLIEISKSSSALARADIDAEVLTLLKRWVASNSFRASLHMTAGFIGLYAALA